MKMKKYITFKDYNYQINKYNKAVSSGFKPIMKKNWIKIGCGFVCLSIAIFPNGLGIIFFPLSFMLLGLSFKDIIEYKRKAKNKIREFKVML